MNTPLALTPWPMRVQAGDGQFVFTPTTCLVADAAAAPTAETLAAQLRLRTGMPLPRPDQRPASGAVVLALNPQLAHLGAEGYRLVVTATAVDLQAPTAAGLFWATQTLYQLLPAAAGAAGAGVAIPAVIIEDQPRFGWRGLMLDTGHDYQHLSFIYRFIDLMVLHKFNRLHWHITDLGTWPLEIDGYPRLQDPCTLGTRRRGTPPRGVKPGRYTHAQVREVVAYAAARHVTVVPEIDMPGHSAPALMAYPEFDCPVPHRTWEWERWEYCVGQERTYDFLHAVLSQVMALFPSPYIHIGGDECPKDHWRLCPVCQARRQAEGLADEDELQSWFVRRIERFLNAHGRRLIGWDEILEGGLAPDATVMSWRGVGGGIAAAQAGHDVVMAPTSHTYFDYPETTTSVAKVYQFEPVPAELSAAQARHILGAQAQMWTDNHPTEAEIERLVYPRACALAEVVWSPAAARDADRFAACLAAHAQRLAALGLDITGA